MAITRSAPPSAERKEIDMTDQERIWSARREVWDALREVADLDMRLTEAKKGLHKAEDKLFRTLEELRWKRVSSRTDEHWFAPHVDVSRWDGTDDWLEQLRYGRDFFCRRVRSERR
jgi:hypothetical protein